MKRIAIAAAVMALAGCSRQPAESPKPEEKPAVFQACGAEFATGRREFKFDGVVHWLAYPADFKDGKPVFTEDDITMTLAPLTSDDTLTMRNIKKIVLDPGHGGKQPGAVVGSTEEKILNLDIAKRVEELLKKRGFTVVMTRTDDRDLELAPRAAVPAACGADLFVSIHCNAAPTPALKGIECFSITPRGARPSNDDGSLPPPDPNEETTGYACTADSFALASALQSRLIKSTGATDRGTKRARFRVLYSNTVPAALVECGFMTNTDDAKLLADPSYRQLLAESIASGIADFAARVSPIK
ncbi:MAG: N-acetylmuramoyl-L-alanine amidase [Victivallaceae bacterium]|nr:N-acetylmuramoyl-L-alanine amidase [Victivallaceae bacterium]